MNMNLTAHINIETPDGLRLAKELAGHPEDVIIETPVGSEKFYTLNEVFDKSLTKMRTHYGDDFAKNYEKDFRNRKWTGVSKLFYSEEAERDIDEYIQFIIDVYKAPATAEKHYVEIFDLLRKLEYNAEVSTPSNEDTLKRYGLGARRINYKRIAIIYTIHSDVVYIRRVKAQSLIY